MRKLEIFNETIEIFFWGKIDGGDWHPARAIEKIERKRQDMQVQTIVAPSLGFTNRVVDFSDVKLVGGTTPLLRSKKPADGAIISWDKDNPQALGIFNADCHVGLIFDEEDKKLCLVHLGWQCFFRKDGGPSIIEVAVKKIKKNPSQLKFWFGAGIGRCCNGYVNHEHREAMADAFPNCIGGKVDRGPRAGQEAYDNFAMIFDQMLKVGFQRFEYDNHCTSCMGVTSYDVIGYGHYYSNVRDIALAPKKVGERNAFFAKIKS